MAPHRAVRPRRPCSAERTRWWCDRQGRIEGEIAIVHEVALRPQLRTKHQPAAVNPDPEPGRDLRSTLEEADDVSPLAIHHRGPDAAGSHDCRAVPWEGRYPQARRRLPLPGRLGALSRITHRSDVDGLGPGCEVQLHA